MSAVLLFGLLAAQPAVVDEFPGTLVVDTVKLSARADGVVEKVLVKEGQYVKKGDVLVAMDKRRAEVESAAASAAVEKARATADRARADADRFAQLAKGGGVSAEEVARADTAARVAAAELSIAHARLELAKLDLEGMFVVAPTDGLVTNVTAKAGARTNPTVPLVTLAEPATLRVELKVKEADLARLAKVKKCFVRLAADPAAAALPAQVERVKPLVNADHTVTVTVKLDEVKEPEKLIPGRAVRVQFVREK